MPPQESLAAFPDGAGDLSPIRTNRLPPEKNSRKKRNYADSRKQIHPTLWIHISSRQKV
jgi:hypothetical protein